MAANDFDHFRDADDMERVVRLRDILAVLFIMSTCLIWAPWDSWAQTAAEDECECCVPDKEIREK